MEEEQALADRAFLQFGEERPVVDEEFVTGPETDYLELNELKAQEERLESDQRIKEEVDQQSVSVKLACRFLEKQQAQFASKEETFKHKLARVKRELEELKSLSSSVKQDTDSRQRFLSQISDLSQKAQSLKYPSHDRALLAFHEQPDLQKILSSLTKEKEKKTSFELVYNSKAKDLIQGNRIFNLRRRLERIKTAVSGFQSKHQTVTQFLEPLCTHVTILQKTQFDEEYKKTKAMLDQLLVQKKEDTILHVQKEANDHGISDFYLQTVAKTPHPMHTVGNAIS